MGDCYKFLRKLFVVASIGVIFSFFLTYTSAAVIIEIPNNEVTNNCLDKDCNEVYLELTKQINTTLDISTNPCDNIQQFVCGESKFKSFSKKEELAHKFVNKRMESLVSQPSDFDDFRPFKLLKDLYNTCMRYEKTGQQSLGLLGDIIKKLGSWPLLEGDNWKESDFDWIDFSIKSQNLGLVPLQFPSVLKIEYRYDDKSIVNFPLLIPYGEFVISNPSDVLTEAYKKYIAKVSELLGNTQISEEEIDEIVAFERDISRLQDYIHHNKFVSFGNITKEFPSTNLEKFFNNIRARKNETSINLSKLNIFQHYSLSDFLELIENVPKRVQANYAIWKTIQALIPYFTEEYRELKREYCLTKECFTSTERRESFCFSQLKKYLSPALKLMFTKNFYNNDIGTIVTEMVENIKEQFVQLTHESTWMNKEMKNQAFEIIGNISFVIGDNEKSNTDDEFLKYYENLEINTNNYLQTLLNLELFGQNLKTDTNLGGKYLYNDGEVYFDGFKTLYIPLSMLQEPFFSVNYPMYVNYGYTGKAIAEKMAEMIVRKGEISITNVDWFHHEKVSCFLQQMEYYVSHTDVKESMRELFYPGNQISEHIAYKATYRAYQKWLTKNGIEPSLPGLPFSNSQLFWINSIRYSCDSYPRKPIVIDDKYSTFDFYKMNVVTNFPEFYKDFKCPTDSSFAENYGPACTF